MTFYAFVHAHFDYLLLTTSSVSSHLCTHLRQYMAAVIVFQLVRVPLVEIYSLAVHFSISILRIIYLSE